jgi:hypothetical protein
MSLQHLLKYERRLLKEKRNILKEKRSLILDKYIVIEEVELEVLDRELELLKLLLYQKKLLLLHQKFLDNFQIDPSWEDFGKVTDEKIDFQIDPAWEDFGKVEVKDEEWIEEKKIDFQIDPAWEDFENIEEEERVKRIAEEERVAEEKRVAEEEQIAEKERIVEEKLNVLKIKDIFGERFQYVKGYSLYIPALNRLAPDLMSEIKKVLEKDETIAFFDYTYNINKTNKSTDNIWKETTSLNYLNIITHKGNIYSVKFKMQYNHDPVGRNSWDVGLLVPLSHPGHHTPPYYYNIMFEKKHTFHPTKRNLDILKTYCGTINKEDGYSEIYKVLSLLD